MEIKNGIYYPRIIEEDFTIELKSDSLEIIDRKIRSQEAYNGAILAPLFIALSLLLGTAIFYKVLFWMNKGLNIPLGSEIILRFRKLLIYFTFAVFYLTILSHLTNLYATKHHEYEFFLLF